MTIQIPKRVRATCKISRLQTRTDRMAASHVDFGVSVCREHLEGAVHAVNRRIKRIGECAGFGFFGCGDGSNGYYAERPEPTLALVRATSECRSAALKIWSP
jgi:hypothetical protein